MKFFIFTIFISFFLFAQDNDKKKNLFFVKQQKKLIEEDIILTPYRINNSKNTIGKSFNVISQKEISRSGSRNLADLLTNYSANINIGSNGPRGTTGIFLRGHQSYHTKILIDGITIGDTANTQVSYQSTINSIPLNNIEKIEIVRGSQSTLYGSDAIAGVINIITKKGQEKTVTEITTTYGSYDFFEISTNIRGKTDSLTYALNYTFSDENGISALSSDLTQADKDKYLNNYWNYNLSYDINKYLKINLTGNFAKTSTNFDNIFFGSEKQVEKRNQAFSRSGISLNLGLLKIKTGLEYSEVHRRNSGSGIFDNIIFDGKSSKFDFLANAKINKNYRLILGFEKAKQSINGTYNPNESILYTNFFLQNQLNFHRTHFNLGYRLAYYSTFQDKHSFDLSFIQHINNKLSIHSSFSTGFRSPSPYELFDNFSGNKNLIPETSQSSDLGFSYYVSSKFQISSTIFYADINDAIIYNNSTFRYNNLSNLRSYGLESFIKYETNRLSCKLSYTYTKTDSVDGNNEDKKQARIPKNALNININYQISKKLNLNSNYQYRGSRYNDAENKLLLPSYNNLNLSLQYSYRKNIKLTLSINDIFNERPVLASAGNRAYNTYGRSLYLQGKYTF